MLFTSISVVLACGLAILSAAPVSAVNMTYYKAGKGVEPGFKRFLTQFYTEAEDPTSTDDFTAYFAKDAVFNNEGVIGVGYGPILADKQSLCAPNAAPGGCLDHYVNVTSVFAETPSNKTYLINGAGKIVIQGTCRMSWYQTQLTVSKCKNGKVNLRPSRQSIEQTFVAVVQRVNDPCTII